jgi:hypothetical protein
LASQVGFGRAPSAIRARSRRAILCLSLSAGVRRFAMAIISLPAKGCSRQMERQRFCFTNWLPSYPIDNG